MTLGVRRRSMCPMVLLYIGSPTYKAQAKSYGLLWVGTSNQILWTLLNNANASMPNGRLTAPNVRKACWPCCCLYSEPPGKSSSPRGDIALSRAFLSVIPLSLVTILEEVQEPSSSSPLSLTQAMVLEASVICQALWQALKTATSITSNCQGTETKEDQCLAEGHNGPEYPFTTCHHPCQAHKMQHLLQSSQSSARHLLLFPFYIWRNADFMILWILSCMQVEETRKYQNHITHAKSIQLHYNDHFSFWPRGPLSPGLCASGIAPCPLPRQSW